MNQATPPKIRTVEALAAYPSATALANALGIKRQAVQAWGKYVPDLRAYQLRDLLPEKFGNGSEF